MANTRKRGHDQVDTQEEQIMPSGIKTIRVDGKKVTIQDGNKVTRVSGNDVLHFKNVTLLRMDGSGKMVFQTGSNVRRIPIQQLIQTNHKDKGVRTQGSGNTVQIQEIKNNDGSDGGVKIEKEAEIINAVTELGFDENAAKDLLKSGGYKSAEQLADALFEKEERLKQEDQQRQDGLNDRSQDVNSNGASTSYAETSGNGHAAVNNFGSSQGGGSVSSTETEVAGTSAEYQKLVEKIRELKEERLCKVCMEREACITFVPCGHFVACEKCYSGLKVCPICLSTFETTIKTYIPKE